MDVKRLHTLNTQETEIFSELFQRKGRFIINQIKTCGTPKEVRVLNTPPSCKRVCNILWTI